MSNPPSSSAGGLPLGLVDVCWYGHPEGTAGLLKKSVWLAVLIFVRSIVAARKSWVLHHSAHQVLALVDTELLASRRLKRREVESISRRWVAGQAEADDIYVQVPIREISHLAADNVKRRLVVLTLGREIDLRGFPRRPGTAWIQRGNMFDTHDTLNPGSPVAEAAELIAEAAGLQLVSDRRAEVLHYQRNPRSAAGYEVFEGGELRLRQWMHVAVMMLAIVPSVTAFLWIGRDLLEEYGVGSSVGLRLVLPMLVVLALVAAAAFELVAPVTVGPEGIGVPTRGRKSNVRWSEVEMVHGVTDRETMFGTRQVQIVCSDGRVMTLRRLTVSQIRRLASAIAVHGIPFGIAHDLRPEDFSYRYGYSQEYVPSAISTEVFGSRF